jgi:hypothetical protein
MASPVIFDDGGSTRIKLMDEHGGVGSMDRLLNVNVNRTCPASRERVRGPYTHIKIVSLEADGSPSTLLESGLIPGDAIAILSFNGQSVIGTIDDLGRCVILVQGKPENIPLVEAKQVGNKRRYVVSNAGSIRQIEGRANGEHISFDTRDSIYTTVIMS